MIIPKKTTLEKLIELKRTHRKFSMLTCYDARTAGLMESAGVEVLLVGDTAAEVVLGLPTTREIPAEFLLHLTAAVRRGAPNSFVMGDLPFACRSGDNVEAALDWSRRCCDQAGADAVKMEVTQKQTQMVEAVRNAGIPVVAHLGLLPQMADLEKGYRARGKDAADALVLIQDAKRMEDAGAVMILLEAVASEVAREITSNTKVPVIGCASGPHCDGTVVVLHDMIGWGGGHPPKSVKRYQNLAEILSKVFAQYTEDIHTGRFPNEDDAIHMKPGEYEKLLAHIGES